MVQLTSALFVALSALAMSAQGAPLQKRIAQVIADSTAKWEKACVRPLTEGICHVRCSPGTSIARGRRCRQVQPRLGHRVHDAARRGRPLRAAGLGGRDGRPREDAQQRRGHDQVRPDLRAAAPEHGSSFIAHDATRLVEFRTCALTRTLFDSPTPLPCRTASRRRRTPS